MHVHNSCDVAGLCPNAELLSRQARQAGAAVQDVMLTWLGDEADACTDACGAASAGDPNVFRNPLGWTIGLWNHMIWPWRRTSAMIDFLGGHPPQRQADDSQ
jgi:hypothetical protein